MKKLTQNFIFGSIGALALGSPIALVVACGQITENINVEMAQIPVLNDVVLKDGQGNGFLSVQSNQSGWEIQIIEANSETELNSISPGTTYRLKFILSGDFNFDSESIPTWLIQNPTNPNVYYSDIKEWSPSALALYSGISVTYNSISNEYDVPEMEGWEIKILISGTNIEKVNFNTGDPYDLEFTLNEGYRLSSVDNSFEKVSDQENSFKLTNLLISEFAYPLEAVNFQASYNRENGDWSIPSFKGWDASFIDPETNEVKEEFAVGDQYRIRYQLQDGFIASVISGSLTEIIPGFSYETSEYNLRVFANAILGDQVAIYDTSEKTWAEPDLFGWTVTIVDPETGLVLADKQSNFEYALQYSLKDNFDTSIVDKSVTKIGDSEIYRTKTLRFSTLAYSLIDGQVATYDAQNKNWIAPTNEGWTTEIVDPVSRREISDPEIGTQYALKYTLLDGYSFAAADPSLTVLEAESSYLSSPLILTKPANSISNGQVAIYNSELEIWEAPTLEGWNVTIVDPATGILKIVSNVDEVYALRYTLASNYIFSSVDLALTAIDESNIYQTGELISDKNAASIDGGQFITFNTDKNWVIPTLEGWIVQAIDPETSRELINFEPGISYALQYTLRSGYTFLAADQSLILVEAGNLTYKTNPLTLIKLADEILGNEKITFSTQQNKYITEELEGWTIKIVDPATNQELVELEFGDEYVLLFTLEDNYLLPSLVGSNLTQVGSSNVYQSQPKVWKKLASQIPASQKLVSYNKKTNAWLAPTLEGWIVTFIDSSSDQEMESLTPGSSYYLKYTLDSESYGFTSAHSSLTEIVNSHTYMSSSEEISKFIAEDIPVDSKITNDGWNNFSIPQYEGWTTLVVQDWGTPVYDYSVFEPEYSYGLYYTLDSDYAYLGDTHGWEVTGKTLRNWGLELEYQAADLPSWTDLVFNSIGRNVTFPEIDGWNLTIIDPEISEAGDVVKTTFNRGDSYILKFSLKNGYDAGFIGENWDTSENGIARSPSPLYLASNANKKYLTSDDTELTVDIDGNIIIPRYSNYTTYIINRTTGEYVESSNEGISVYTPDAIARYDGYGGIEITKAADNKMKLVHENVYEILAVSVAVVTRNPDNPNGTYPVIVPNTENWDSTAWETSTSYVTWFGESHQYSSAWKLARHTFTYYTFV